MWDIKSDSRKPFHSIQTIAPVSCIQWRPGFETHIAYCSLSNDFRVQLYDICSPFVPLATLNSHENVVSGFLWKDSDILYSCSKDCTFRIHNFDVDGIIPGDLLTESCMSFNSSGNLMFSLGFKTQIADVKKVSKRSVLNRWDDKVIYKMFKIKESYCCKNQQAEPDICFYGYRDI